MPPTPSPSYNPAMSFSTLIWQTILFFLTFGRAVTSSLAIRGGCSRLAGGMLAFAAGVLTLLLGTFAPSVRWPALALTLYRLQRLPVVLPALFWLAAMIWLIPQQGGLGGTTWPSAVTLLGLSLACVLAYGVVISFYHHSRNQTFPAWIGTFIAIDLFIFTWWLPNWTLPTKGSVVVIHFLRAFDYSFFTALIFGGQVVWVMWYSFGLNYPLVLLLASVAASVLIQTFQTRCRG
ncbi:MAG: hypothetical protein R3D55_02090 [Chloroflexota bacterium]